MHLQKHLTWHGFALVVVSAVLVVGCSSAGSPATATPVVASASPSPVMTASVPSTGPVALRTFQLWRGVECDAIAVDNPVTGRLDGDPADPRETVWLRAPDGTRLSIVWPEGFSVRFEPNAILYNEEGRIVARAGDAVKFGGVSRDEAVGTFEDPYYAAGLIFEGCYPRRR